MKSYTLWGQIRRTADGKYSINVRAVPLQSGVLPQAGESVTETSDNIEDATLRRDALLERLRALLEDRGDRVLSVDSTLGP